ncbi:THAP domain-containing protein 2-like [Diabrotica virgifera virgifera]|uniref:THAP-type domain-containing protein n=2 Tax=Diabrotica virgifera virgifera TaxID=50390 RepID=A0ABM5L539_DIAVI|nr:THAP domain-containing protein 2-like [Diabrotica virgifera virgifera]
MASCAFPLCTNNKRKNQKNSTGITFHSFPKDVEKRKAWVQFVHRENWEPATSSKLCTKHFAERDVDRTSLVCIRLRENAVPTIGESQFLEKNQYFSLREPPASYITGDATSRQKGTGCILQTAAPNISSCSDLRPQHLPTVTV